MRKDSDTRILQHESLDTTRRKKNPGFISPLWIASGVFVVLVGCAAVVLTRAIREKEAKTTGVMEAAYTARSLVREMSEPIEIKPPPKFNRVIFRLGDEEIFRFIYEDSGDGRRYSFEVREGSS